jgi:arylsulfatase A-like enzyme
MSRLRRALPPSRTTVAWVLLLAAALIGGCLAAWRAEAAVLVRPNVVLVLTDDETMDAVARMPYVSSRTNWISFDRAYIDNSLCCPSRATILRGQYDTHTRVENNAQGKLLDERETLAVWLRRAGYRTGLFGKYLNRYPFGKGLSVPPGWTDWQVAYSVGTDWDLYDQYHWKLDANGVSRSFLDAPADYQVTVLANRTISFIKASAAAHQPFFAMFTPSATHDPWRASPTRAGTMATAPVPPQPSFDLVAADQPAYLQAQPLLNQATMDAERRMEWEGAASVDDAVKRIDTALKNAGVLNQTVLIFMTDNGYSFGNHRWERKRCEFNECGQTPLLVRYPGVAARHDTTHLISNVDLAATISDLAGATPAVPQDGSSFLPLIGGQSIAWRTSMLLHWPGGDMDGLAGMPESMPQFWGVLADTPDGGRWKYVELDTGERELYDESADPHELTNLVDDPAYSVQRTQLQAQLADLEAHATGGAPSPLRADQPVPGPVGPDLD